MRAWIGRWIVGVALIHILLSALVFRTVFEAILRKGVIDAVGSDPTTGLAVWCVLFGGALLVVGLAVTALEKRSSAGESLPRSIGWALLALALLGVALMPASGFWLAFPPALAVLIGKPGIRHSEGI